MSTTDFLDNFSLAPTAGKRLTQVCQLVTEARHAIEGQQRAESALIDAIESLETVRDERDKLARVNKTLVARHERKQKRFENIRSEAYKYLRRSKLCQSENHNVRLAGLGRSVERYKSQLELAEDALISIEHDRSGSGRLIASGYFGTKEEMESARLDRVSVSLDAGKAFADARGDEVTK